MDWSKAFISFADRQAIWHDGKATTYAELEKLIEQYISLFKSRGIQAGAIVLLSADYDVRSIAAYFALLDLKCIVVPHTGQEPARRLALAKLSHAELLIRLDGAELEVQKGPGGSHPLVDGLRIAEKPGLILFSSGSSGVEKAILHDFERFSLRFGTSYQAAQLSHASQMKASDRIAAFLLFDHIGGQNTMLMTFATGGCLILLAGRGVSATLKTLKLADASVLPCSPTFLRLLLATPEADLDIPSLRLITYGTEVMPPSILEALAKRLPNVRLKQTYGLSETGILPTKSPDRNSTFFAAGDASNKVRVVEEMIEIWSSSLMLGYLNAENPFTEDGWFKTGDQVEMHDELIKIVGRKSDVINVGGLKVLPSEVESVLSAMSEIEDVVVEKEAHALMGEIVVAHVKPNLAMSLKEITRAIQNYARGRLDAHKIPQKVVLHDEELYTGRFKRKRFNK